MEETNESGTMVFHQISVDSNILYSNFLKWLIITVCKGKGKKKKKRKKERKKNIHNAFIILFLLKLLTSVLPL
jgi:hypothetical protein